MRSTRLLVVIAALLLGGCASFRDPPPPSSHGSTRGVTYYATDALAVHATPSDGSKVVGRLAPNARVSRRQVDRGWARIKADGVEGWVDASRLATEPAP